MEAIYDDVEVTVGVTLDARAPSPKVPATGLSGYKTLLKQNSKTEYANLPMDSNALSTDESQFTNINPRDNVSNDTSFKNGKGKKMRRNRTGLLVCFVLFTALLSLAALAVAIVTTVTLKQEVAEYKGQLDRLTEEVSDFVNGTLTS